MTDITVVIPVWDEYVRYLPNAVASVRDEGESIAIVVVDNASAVPVEVVEGARLVRAPHRLSVGAARNLGLGQVKTHYAMVMDADDTLEPGALGFMKDRLARDEELVACATSIRDAASGGRYRSPRPFVRRLVRFPRTFALANAVWSLVPIQGCALIRIPRLEGSGGYADADWGDDRVLMVSLSFRGRVEVHARYGRRYQDTPGSISDRDRSKRDLMQSARLVRDRIRSDPEIPTWARSLTPAIYALQWLAVYVVRPTYRRLRHE